jgi:anti-anti-sigma factor
VTTVQDRSIRAAPRTKAALVPGLGGCRAVAARIDSALRRGATHVVVDFGAVSMIDAATLTTLHRHARRLRSRGERLSVVCEHRGLSGLLRMTLLDRSFEVFTSRDALPAGP